MGQATDRWEWWPSLPHWVRADSGQGLKTGFDFRLGAGHVEAQGQKQMSKEWKECLCFRPLRLEYNPASPGRKTLSPSCRGSRRKWRKRAPGPVLRGPGRGAEESRFASQWRDLQPSVVPWISDGQFCTPGTG